MVVHHLIVASMARVRPLASCGLGYGARAWHERRRERAIPPTEAAITSWDSRFDVPLSTLDEFDEPFPSSFVKGSATPFRGQFVRTPSRWPCPPDARRWRGPRHCRHGYTGKARK